MVDVDEVPALKPSIKETERPYQIGRLARSIRRPVLARLYPTLPMDKCANGICSARYAEGAVAARNPW